MKQQVICEHPRVILHPRIAELMCLYQHYFLLGREVRMHRTFVHMDDFDKRPFYPKKLGITLDNMDDCYFVDDSTGETYPMYLAVPCNHCDICKNSKVSQFVKRCEYETESYDYKPWFVTLTYDNQHLPFDGVSKRDAQLFLKRFRRNLERAGYPFKVRYVLVSEYGKLHRAHYHAIIWNIQSKTPKEYMQIADMIKTSWQNGFVMSRLIDPKDDRGFFYTSKYLKKDCEVPKGCNDTFMLSSRGHGGIGSRFIDKIAPELQRTLNVDFKYFSKWQGCVKKLQFNRYLLNRVFPSFCRSVAAPFRQAVIGAFQQWRYVSIKMPLLSRFDFESLYNKYSKYFYICNDKESKFWLNQPDDLIVNSADNLHRFITREEEKYRAKGKTFDMFQKLADLREKFLVKLFQFTYPIDMKMRAYVARTNINYSSIYQVL